jgi:hypothetical protein
VPSTTSIVADKWTTVGTPESRRPNEIGTATQTATGVEGAKEALWYFAQQQLNVQLAWSPTMYGGTFAGRQPESLTRTDTEALLIARAEK